MILIICAWVYCFLLIFSIGAGSLKLISKLGGDSLNVRFGVFYQFWFGFAMLIGLLQLISLFLPIGNTAVVILSLLAILFAGINFRHVGAKLLSFCQWLFTPKGFISFVAICMMALMVSYTANKEVTHTDTFLYHFNAVKWARDYPVVPGLANLHSRLGFNSSFFLFAAFTEIGLYANHSAHIALSFLMVICLIHWFFVISNPRELMAKRIFCMITFLFLFIHVTLRIDMASLSTDYPMAIMTLIFCIVLLDRLENKLLLLLPLSAVVFSVKLSGMLTIGVSIIMLLGYILLLKHGNIENKFRRVQTRVFAVSFILFSFIVSGFVIRNMVISGWLLYPFPLGNLHMPWSIPKAYVLDMIDTIKSYPKLPGGASPTTIRENDFFFWFTQWFAQFRLSREFGYFVASAFVLLWAGFQVPSLLKFIYARLNMLLLVLFSLSSILFWFITAPDVRFGSIYFFIFFASSMALLYEGSKHKSVLKILIYGLFISQVVSLTPGYYIDREPNLFTFPFTKPLKLKRVIASPADENPPLYIYMPLEGNQCGNSPLPCTPYAGGFLDSHRLIKQRVPGNLSKGFLPTK